MAQIIERIIGQEIMLEIVDQEPLPLPADSEERAPGPGRQRGPKSPTVDDLVPDHSGAQDLY